MFVGTHLKVTRVRILPVLLSAVFIHLWTAACTPDRYNFLPFFPRARRAVLCSASFPEQWCYDKLFARDQTCEIMTFWTQGYRVGVSSPFIQILWLPQSSAHLCVGWRCHGAITFLTFALWDEFDEDVHPTFLVFSVEARVCWYLS